MIDKATETRIKAMEEFLEFWGRFHSLYNQIISKEVITKDDEDKFIESKSLMHNKYESLRAGLEFKYMPHGRLTDPVLEILSLGGIHFMSEDKLKKVGEDWKGSYLFLNNILERLKNKKRRLEQFNPVGVFMKRVMERAG